MTWRASDLLVRPIASSVANEFIRRTHYSKKVVPNSQVHLGVFLPDGVLHGVMQFGPPMVRRVTLGLVSGTKWNDMLELNRMAFDEVLPRNSESRALAVALRMLRKRYPNVEWILSFSDGCQSGDGTIYRATGFLLCGIKKNTGLGRSGGQVVTRMASTKGRNILRTGRAGLPADFEALPGFQLRYIYFLNPLAQARLTVPVLPFSAIDEAGARMYRGQRGGKGSGAGTTSAEGGSIPTPPLE